LPPIAVNAVARNSIFNRAARLLFSGRTPARLELLDVLRGTGASTVYRAVAIRLALAQCCVTLHQFLCRGTDQDYRPMAHGTMAANGALEAVFEPMTGCARCEGDNSRSTDCSPRSVAAVLSVDQAGQG
jgi:hypothetical protein